MWEIFEKDLDKKFEVYYNSIHRRRARAGKATIPKQYIKTLFYKWADNQKYNQHKPPGSVAIYPNKPHADAKALAEDLLFDYRKGKFYPTAKFLSYFDIERINTPTMVNTLEYELSKVKIQLEEQKKDFDLKIAKTQMVVTQHHEVLKRLIAENINEGKMEDVGIFPPADETKIIKGLSVLGVTQPNQLDITTEEEIKHVENN